MSELQNSQTKTENLPERPPIVVVMGHVDHGKTTLLDYIKKTTVAAREAGGITQSIGAYEVMHQSPINADNQRISADRNQQESASNFSTGKKITFIDTPGHEAFSKMRARGATLADLAILVVAADDGVKPQTKEVLSILNSAKTPFIVAINKIDKNNADIERAKNELLQSGVLLEGLGGNVSWTGISAKTGEGVSELLDLLLLAAEIEGLRYDPASEAKGVIIEAELDRRRGVVASVILRDGTLQEGKYIGTPTARGKIKILENFKGERVKELTPSAPALILGFETLPAVGEEFTASNSPMLADISANAANIRDIGVQISDGPRLNVFLKADVSGSLEVIGEVVGAMADVRIIGKSVGDITDGDVKNAAASQALVVGFRVGANKTVENLARAQGVLIVNSPIIYELIKMIEVKLAEKKAPPPEGDLEILALFSQKGRRQVVGGKVLEGRIKNNTDLKVLRAGEEIGAGRITNLQHDKEDVHVVNSGDECGIMLDSAVTIAVGDHLVEPVVL